MTTLTRLRRPSCERGAIGVFLAVLVPGLLLIIGLAVDGGAKVAATQRANAIADEAARAGGQALDVSAALTGQVRIDPAAAVAAALAGAQAERTLAAQDLRCKHTVDVDTAGFSAPPGRPGDVTVSITCVVGMADLLAPGLPGAVTVEASFTSPVDAYRER